MAVQEQTNDDLYRYDGPYGPTHMPDDGNILGNKHLTQDSVIDASTIAAAVHYDLVGTVCVHQAIPAVSENQVKPRLSDPASQNEHVTSTIGKAWTIADFRKWSDAFKPFPAEADNDKSSNSPDYKPSLLSRKQSLTAGLAKVLKKLAYSQTSSERRVESQTTAAEDDLQNGQNESGGSTLQERPTLSSMKTSPILPHKTTQQEKGDYTQEEYKAIECARVMRIKNQDADELAQLASRMKKREEEKLHIAEWRLEYLDCGRSEQSEARAAAEIKALEEAISVHRDDRSNNERLVHDYLAAAADRMIIDLERSIQGTLRRNEPAFPKSLSPYMMYFIESFPILKERFRLDRDTEKMHFPDRFDFENRDRHMSGGRQNRYKNTTTQDISFWDGNSLTVDDFGYPLQRIESHSIDPKTANKLPQSFKVKAPRVLDILQSEGESNSPRVRDPTLPQSSPETGYFWLPLPKRTTPLDFMGAYPDAPDPSVTTATYIPPTPPLKNSILSRSNRQAAKLSAPAQAKRRRSLLEPLTPDNINEAVKLNENIDCADAMEWKEETKDEGVYYESDVSNRRVVHIGNVGHTGNNEHMENIEHMENVERTRNFGGQVQGALKNENEATINGLSETCTEGEGQENL
ncbi:hypothetical protein N0V94_007394 [Neodidymelliopsis sp. IMI 364377]|nr:hypothetical protein N0V94_007394 [Neodidymelliopsis sp. IMI 364377]